MVSHSQRIKLKEDNLMSEMRREHPLRPKIRSNYETKKLAEISENPENIKIAIRNHPSTERARFDASPSENPLRSSNNLERPQN